jgi:putative transcriptional regulator
MKTKKRNLFDELKQGISEINDYRAKKITLRTEPITEKSLPRLEPSFIQLTRETLNMSRNVFARKLRVSSRTLEKWEQGVTKPNDQAVALILMVNKYPDTLTRLEDIG